MNLDSLTAALSHIGYLVHNLAKKNQSFDSCSLELLEIIQTFEGEAERHLFRVIVGYLEWWNNCQVTEDVNSTTANSAATPTSGVASISPITLKDKDVIVASVNWNSEIDDSGLNKLVAYLASLIPFSRFVTNLAQAVDSPYNPAKYIKPHWVTGVCKVLKLSLVKECCLCLYLFRASSAEVRNQAIAHLKVKLAVFIKTYIENANSEDFQDLNTESIHLLLTNIRGAKHQSFFGITPELSQKFVTALQKEFSRDRVPVALNPLLYPNSEFSMDRLNQEQSANMTKNLLKDSLVDFVKELGYSFTSSVEECRNNIIRYGKANFTDRTIARVFGFMVRTVSGLESEQIGLQNLGDPSSLWGDIPKDKAPGGGQQVRSPPGGADDSLQSSNSGGSNALGPDTWNIEVFVRALYEVFPILEPHDVAFHFTQEGLVIRNRAELELFKHIVDVLFRMFGKPTETFNMHSLFAPPHKQKENRLLTATTMLKNLDVFNPLDYQCEKRKLDCFKTLPDLENKEIAVWKCVDLVILLCDCGEKYEIAVRELLKFPISHCPDLLTYQLIHLPRLKFPLVPKLLQELLPIFFGNHPNSGIILHTCWNQKFSNDYEGPGSILMSAMNEWYMMAENDQARLSRILDLAQDLKALSNLLNSRSFPFMIDLACLAYRREFLKLDKWLSDKIQNHGEPFKIACVKFLQTRCPQLVGGNEDLLPKSAHLPKETVNSILTQIQPNNVSVSKDVAVSIFNMTKTWDSVVNQQTRTPIPMPGLSDVLPPTTSLSNLTIGPPTQSMFPPVSSSINLSSLAELAAAPGSPAAIAQSPMSGTGMPGVTSQSPLASMFPPVLGGNHTAPPQHPAIGSQLVSLPSTSIISGAGAGPTVVIPPPVRTHPMPSTSQTTRPAVDLKNFFETPPVMNQDIENEANSYFQRIYNQPPRPTISIEEVLRMLKKFNNSDDHREREVYSCMLKNLYDEYKFFPTYPQRELITTAQLIGGIIDQGLVEFMALGIALRYVMEALQRPHSSKMYYFGIVSLDKFKGRLKEYPRYCQHLFGIEHFKEFPPHLQEYIRHGTNSQEPPGRPTGAVLPPMMEVSSPPTTAPPGAVGGDPGLHHLPPGTQPKSLPTPVATTQVTTTSAPPVPPPVARPQPHINPPNPSGKPVVTTNIDSLLVAKDCEEKTPVPPEHVQDKISFIFNNLSKVNLTQKTEELKEIMSDEYWLWVSQYLVMKRASIENNFHPLYSSLIDHLKMESFNTMVTDETLRNIKVLLRADKTSANFSDKSLLKNLGHWLGLLTLGKGRPILHIDIDVRSLVIEAYSKGLAEMQYVVPFVAKVMESCYLSKVFKPPNPWTMAIMNVLAELHLEQDMKLHLKFEIELLCKNLKINREELTPAGILKLPETMARIKTQLSMPGGKRAESTPLFAPLPSVNPYPFNPPDGSMTTQSSSTGATPTPPSVHPHPPTTPTPIQALTNASVEPRFHYSEINLSLRGLDAHISVGSQPDGLAGSSQLKQLVRQAVEVSVQEIINAVMERSVKVAVTTTDHLIKKDFALDPDEGRLRIATHHMVRNLTAAMAMITCRDHMVETVSKNIKQVLLPFLNTRTNPVQIEPVEQLAANIAQENVGIACAFIQKTAAEKAVSEMDKRLLNEYEARKVARADGRRYCDSHVLTYQAERMPEQIRLKVGRVTSTQMAVYEEFARNIPGFLPTPPTTTPAQESNNVFLQKPVPVATACDDELTAFLLLTERVHGDLDHTLQAFNTMAPSSTLISMLQALTEGLCLIRNNCDIHTVNLLIRKIIDNLLEGVRDLPADPEPELNQLYMRFRDLHLFVLKAMADVRSFGPVWTSKNVTKWWMEAREEIKYHLEVVNWLLKSSLMNIQMIDEHLARVIDDPRYQSYGVLCFIMQIIQVYLVEDTTSNVMSETDLSMTLDALMRLCSTRQGPDGLVQLLETLRLKNDVIANERSCEPGSVHSYHPSSLHFHSGVAQARDFQVRDPPGLQDKTDMLLADWIQMYHSPGAGHGSSAVFQPFVKQMDLHGILKTDELITRFFRICITMCRDMCVRTILDQGPTNTLPTFLRNKCFQTLDAFVRLISLLIKHSGEATNPTTKINLLNKVLGLVSGTMMHDIDTNGSEFQQLPYHRILIMLFLELNAPETILESINLPVLMAFTQTLHLLRPSKTPGFAYAWLEMVSHRVFIGRMLAITPQQKGWNMYSMLLVDLFTFLSPFLRNAELNKPISSLYKGTLRVLLVLLHDFPEFLCEYHYTFCEVIPPNCIQMRNLILSAFPRNMRLPDPFTPNLKVDMLQEITVSPKINAVVANFKLPTDFKTNLDSYLKNRTPVTFLSEMRGFLQVSNEPGQKYNMSVMNALVLYTGMQAISQMQTKGIIPSMITIAHSSHMDIFQNLAVDLDTEGRYLFLNAIANQLRYPNSHTHYFSCTLLYLFVESNTEAIQEQITRVLLERLIVNRPHPWGLLITFIELIKNPTFKFWSHEFVKCAPEIKKLFESVASSCLLDTSRFQGL